MRDDEALDTLLYKYKFSGFSLEKTIKALLELNSVSEYCLTHSKYEEPLKELAWLLVDYKFNKHEFTCKLTFKRKLIKWFEDNIYRLTTADQSTTEEGGGWGLKGLKFP